MDEPGRGDGRAQRRRAADRPVRHPRAAGALAAAARHGRGARGHGARPSPAAARTCRTSGRAPARRRRRLRRRRQQDLDHQRAARGADRHAGEDRPGAEPAHRGDQHPAGRARQVESPGTCPSSATGGWSRASSPSPGRGCRPALLGGEEGRGFGQFMAGLELGRVQVAARASAWAGMDDALAYAQQGRRSAGGNAGRYGAADGGSSGPAAAMDDGGRTRGRGGGGAERRAATARPAEERGAGGGGGRRRRRARPAGRHPPAYPRACSPGSARHGAAAPAGAADAAGARGRAGGARRAPR